MKLWRLVLATVIGMAALLLSTGGVAHGTASGPCTGTLNSIDVAPRSATNPDDAIQVGQNDDVTVVVTSSQAIGHYKVQLSFAGFTWTVAEDDANGTSWTKTVHVKNYAKFGVGLYQVSVVSAGSVPCAGSVLVRIGGSPFGSVAGWLALLLAGTGVGASVVAARRREAGLPLLDSALGALGGIGAVGLSQQFAIAYPTRLFAIGGLALGAAVPMLAHGISRLAGRRPGQLGPHSPGAPSDTLSSTSPGSSTTPGAQRTDPFANPPGAQHADPLPQQQPQPQQHHQHPQPHAHTHAAPTWRHDHVVGPAGATSWNGPDAGASASSPIDPGVELRVLEQLGERVHVECSNGWTTWVAAATIGRAAQ